MVQSEEQGLQDIIDQLKELTIQSRTLMQELCELCKIAIPQCNNCKVLHSHTTFAKGIWQQLSIGTSAIEEQKEQLSMLPHIA